MKKKLILLLIVLFGFMIAPSIANAQSKVKVYLFRGQGCSHCHEFLEFLNNLDQEYKDMFELEAYEVWYDTDNRELWQNIAKFLGEEATGVPYIVIGNKTFAGYASSSDSSIKSTIKSLYKTDESKRYDVMTEYKKSNAVVKSYISTDLNDTLDAEGIKHKTNSKSSSNGTSSQSVILWNLLFTTVSSLIIIIFVNSKLNSLSVKKK